LLVANVTLLFAHLPINAMGREAREAMHTGPTLVMIGVGFILLIGSFRVSNHHWGLGLYGFVVGFLSVLWAMFRLPAVL
jgi:hypothetical protein